MSDQGRRKRREDAAAVHLFLSNPEENVYLKFETFDTFKGARLKHEIAVRHGETICMERALATMTRKGNLNQGLRSMSYLFLWRSRNVS